MRRTLEAFALVGGVGILIVLFHLFVEWLLGPTLQEWEVKTHARQSARTKLQAEMEQARRRRQLERIVNPSAKNGAA